MKNTLGGEHALITGGGTGIGAAVARRLWRAGARITLVGRRREPLERLLAEFDPDDSPHAGYATADVTAEAEVGAAFAAAREARGTVSILVNNAGLAQSSPAAKVSLTHWQATLAVNLTGVFLCAREFLANLPREARGRIVNVASAAGLKGYAYVSAYCAAKHGVVGYTRALAAELARRPVTVNAVCPGYTETTILDEAIANIVKVTGLSEAQARAELVRSNPQGRFIRPEEVAETVHWLCLPESDSITGLAIPVAGGEV